MCSCCGETVPDGREVLQAGSTLCRACARRPYYRRAALRKVLGRGLRI
ncbi:TraR/DksA C4-type zinc finger protein [Desulfosporosinus sp.]